MVTVHQPTVPHDHAPRPGRRNDEAMRTRPLALVAIAAITSVFALGVDTVSAHDPIILTPEQATPADGPLLVDGTISFALYGDVGGPGDTRAFRVRYAAGQTFNLSALVPNLDPERGMSVDQYPTITVVTPSGETIDLQPDEVSTFDEPFTKTSYVQYLEWSTTAEAGDYGVIITGVAPARFTVSTGVVEQFGTAVEDVPNRDLGVAGVMEWYATPPASTVMPTTEVPTTPAPDTTAPATAPDTTAAVATAPATMPVTTQASGESDGQGSTPVVVLVLAVLAAAGLVVWLSRRWRRADHR
jgi:hypothetical protein